MTTKNTDQEITIFTANFEKEFKTIHNSLAEDRRISWAAKGLLIYLLTRPEQWKIKTHQLAEIYEGDLKSNSRDSIKKMLLELRNQEYIKYFKFRNSKGQWEHKYFIFCVRIPRFKIMFPERFHEIKKMFPETKNPKTANPKTENPETESQIKKMFPETANPATVNPALETPSILVNTELVNTELEDPPLTPPLSSDPLGISLRSDDDDSLKIDKDRTKKKDQETRFKPERRALSTKKSYEILNETILSDSDKKRLCRDYPEEKVIRAIEIMKTKNITSNYCGYLMKVLSNLIDEPEEKMKAATPKQQKALEYNAKLAKISPEMANRNEKHIQDNVKLEVLWNGKPTTLSFNAHDMIDDINNLLRVMK